jgi:DNA-binding HxlR family transcriptional regulator
MHRLEAPMEKRDYEELCRFATNASGLIQGKWRIPILCALQGGPIRLGLLTRLIPTASKKVMTENLRQLIRDGVLVRTDLSQTLLHVEYDYDEGFRLRMNSVLTSLADIGVFQANRAGKVKV